MTENDELRMKIAKLKGWKNFYIKDGYLAGEHELSPKMFVVPNYPESIADCYDLEDEIPEDQRMEYIRQLTLIIKTEYGDKPFNLWTLAHATPAQRCNAYIAWRESQCSNKE